MKKNEIFLVIVIMLFINLIVLHADTEIGGGIFTDTTLLFENSPYLVISSITVFPGVTLTIEPGTEIKFQDATVLTIRGNITSVGTVTDSITFTAANTNPTPGIWDGIVFETELGASGEFKHVIGKYALRWIKLTESSTSNILDIENSHFYYNEYVFWGMDSSNGNYQVNIDSCLVENNYYGYIYATHALISNSIFRNNEKAFHGWSGPSIEVINSEISGNSIWGFNMSGIISDCIISNNGLGLRLRNDLILSNNIIQENDVGIEISSYSQSTNTNVLNNCISFNDINVLHTTNININLSGNCWGTYDEIEIQNRIFDAYDDVSLGIIDYTPFITHCLLDTHLTVSPLNIEVGEEEGSFSILIQSNSDWQIVENSDWLYADPIAGTDIDSIMVFYENNINGIQRTTSITVLCSDLSETVTVTQAGIIPELFVTPNNQDVTSDAGNTTFEIISNLDWSVNENTDWLSVSPENGSNNETLIVDYDENTSSFERIATITVTGYDLDESVTVTQAGAISSIDEILFSNQVLIFENYLNPFNPTTEIKFSIQNDSKVEITIHNIKGQTIKTLVQNEFTKGNYTVIWNGDDESGKLASSGVYLYKLMVNGKAEAIRKCLLLK